MRLQRRQQEGVHPDTQKQCQEIFRKDPLHYGWKLLRSSASTSESIWPTRRTDFRFCGAAPERCRRPAVQVLIRWDRVGAVWNGRSRPTACMRILVMYSTYWQNIFVQADHRADAEQVVRPLFSPAAPLPARTGHSTPAALFGDFAISDRRCRSAAGSAYAGCRSGASSRAIRRIILALPSISLRSAKRRSRRS